MTRDSLEFLSITNSNRISNVNADYLYELSEKTVDYDCRFFKANPIRDSSIYYENERMKVLNANKLVSVLQTSMLRFSGGGDCVVAMEGLAYSGKGSSASDLAMYSGAVRKMILDVVLKGNINAFFVFTPGELKNAVGAKGNASKNEVFEKFLEDPGTELADKGSELVSHLRSNKADKYVVDAKGELKHPWEDVVDAYLAVLKLASNFGW